MPVAFLLSPVLAPGAEGREEQRALANDWAVAAAGRSCRAWIPVDPDTGLARFAWAVCEVQATVTDLLVLEADARNKRLCLWSELDEALDNPLNATLLTRILTALATWALERDGSDLTPRQVVRRLIRRLMPSLPPALTLD